MIQDIPYESQTMFVSNNEAKQQRVELISTGQRAARRGSSEHLNTYILHTWCGASKLCAEGGGNPPNHFAYSHSDTPRFMAFFRMEHEALTLVPRTNGYVPKPWSTLK